MSETAHLEFRIRDNANETVAALNGLSAALWRVCDAVNNGFNLSKASRQIENFSSKIKKMVSDGTLVYLTQMVKILERMSKIDLSNISGVGKAVSAINRAMPSTKDAENAAKGNNPVDSAVDTAVPEFGNDALEQRVGRINDRVAATRRIIDDIKKSVSSLGTGISKLLGPLNALWRVAKMRMLRAIVREIASGFREGVENVRAYSKAIEGHFDKAMTTAQDALFKMKNSIGAAVSPLLEMLIPVLQQVVNWIIEAVNYLNQFFALLNGQSSWTRATNAAAASAEKTKKSVSGAAKQMKELLADFDELNIIQSESGGGGGGGANANTPDYASMFEEVTTFDSKIREAVGWIKDNIDYVKQLATEIGAAIALWGVGTAFEGIISKLAGWSLIGLTIKITWDMVTKFDEKYLETGDEGYLLKDILGTAVGSFIGYRIAKKLLGSTVASWIVPVFLTVSAFATLKTVIDNVDKDAFTEENITAMLLGSGKLGLAAALATKSWYRGVSRADQAKTAIGTGVGAALVTMGVATGVMAVMEEVESGYTKDDLVQKAFASLEVGLGAGVVVNAVTKDIKRATGVGVTSALAMMTVMTGIRAVGKTLQAWNEKGEIINDDTLKDIAYTSVTSGITIGYALYKLGNQSPGQSFAGGLGMGAAVFGIAVGIQAIAEASKAINENGKPLQGEVLRDMALTSVSLGLTGGAILSKIVSSGKHGNTGPTAMIAGSIGTAGLIFGIYTSIVAVAEANKAINDNGKAFTGEVIKDMALSSLSMGIAAAGIIKSLGGNSVGPKQMLTSAIGGAMISMGIQTAIMAVGMATKAVNENRKPLEGETLVAMVISSLQLATVGASLGYKMNNGARSGTIYGAVGSAFVSMGIMTAIAAVGMATKAVNENKKPLEGETLTSLIVSSLELGIGAGALFKMTGKKASGTIYGAAGTAFASMGIMTAITAIGTIKKGVDDQDKELTTEGMRTMGISSVEMGLAAASFAKMEGKGGVDALFIGLGAAAVTIGIGYEASAVMTTIEKAKNGDGDILDDEMFYELGMASLSNVAGLTFLGRGLFGGKGGVFGFAAGLAIAGISTTAIAVVDKVTEARNGENGSPLDIKFLGPTIAGAVATGLGVTCAYIAAGTAITTAAFAGGIAAAVVVAAAVTIVAVANMSEKNPVVWGDKELTDEEIQKLVTDKMFTIKPDITIDLANTTISDLSDSKTKLETDMAAVLGTLNIIKLGIKMTEDDYTKLYNKIFGEDGKCGAGTIMGDIKSYCEAQTTLLSTGIQMVPIVNEAGEDVSKEFLEAGMAGWKGITDYMNGLGNQLAEELKKGTTEGMQGFDAELTATLLDQMTRVSTAYKQAQSQSKSSMALVLGLEDLDEKSFGKVVELYAKYRSELEESNKEIYWSEIASFSEMASTYSEMAQIELEKGNTELYEKYTQAAKDAKDMADKLRENYTDSVTSATERQAETGKNLIVEAVQKVIKRSGTGNILGEFSNFLNSNGGWFGENSEDAAKLVLNMIEDTFKTSRKIDFSALEKAGISFADILTDSDIMKYINEQIIDYFKNDDTIDGEEVVANIMKLLFPDSSEAVEEAKKTFGDATDNMNDKAGSTVETFSQAASSVHTSVNDIITDLDRLAGYNTVPQYHFTFGHKKMMASGGFVDEGEMFIAREAGPEMVGRIGNKTAVANNDQIVSGVANGVAAGQSEQNALLRRQNELLTQLLNKKMVAEAIPSSEWARFNKRSEQMYARNVGG